MKKSVVKKTTTSKKTTSASNNENAIYFMKGANDLQSILNNHICNINKKRRSSHELYTPEEVIELIKKHNLEITITALGKIHKLAIQQRVEETSIKLQEQKEYGTMQEKDEHTKHEERLQQEIDSMKKEVAKMKKLLNKATAEKGGE